LLRLDEKRKERGEPTWPPRRRLGRLAGVPPTLSFGGRSEGRRLADDDDDDDD